MERKFIKQWVQQMIQRVGIDGAKGEVDAVREESNTKGKGLYVQYVCVWSGTQLVT